MSPLGPTRLAVGAAEPVATAMAAWRSCRERVGWGFAGEPKVGIRGHTIGCYGPSPI